MKKAGCGLAARYFRLEAAPCALAARQFRAFFVLVDIRPICEGVLVDRLPRGVARPRCVARNAPGSRIAPGCSASFSLNAGIGVPLMPEKMRR